MRIGRKFKKKPMTRPIKSQSEKARRQRQQKNRLIALGVDEDVVRKLNVPQIREMLRRPNKITAGK